MRANTLPAGLLGAALSVALPQAAQAQADPAPRTAPVEDAAQALLRSTKSDLGPTHEVKIVRGIFVLASDAGARLTAQAEGTIGRMFDAMYAEFLTRRPTRPLAVYCFGTKAAYDAYVQRAYGHAPSTPYGFYMGRDRRMVMNLATGTGTLAHELVHPLLAEDFPAVPSWFNEGFASLFEQSTFLESGRARGLTNWRLAGLQEALRAGTAPSLAALLRTSTGEFYDDRRSGVHYALARYLCYFLQEHGALAAFYKEWRQGAGADPTGARTLERVLGVPLPEAEPVVHAFTLRLRFGR